MRRRGSTGRSRRPTDRRCALGSWIGAGLLVSACSRAGPASPPPADESKAAPEEPAADPVPAVVAVEVAAPEAVPSEVEAPEAAAPEAETLEPMAPALPKVAVTLDPRALTQHVHAPVSVDEAIEVDGHTIVVFRYNSLEAYYGGLGKTARKRAKAKFAARRAACEVERAKDLAGAEDDFARLQIENWVPCEVDAARAVRPRRPSPTRSSKEPERPPDDVSPRCSRMEIARLDEEGKVVARVGLTDETCASGLVALELRDFTGDGPQVAVTFSEADYRDLLGGWGWGLEADDTALKVFDLDAGGLERILWLTLDETTYLEDELENTCRYRVAPPGTVTRYWTGWNVEGLEVDRIEWDPKAREWGESVDLPGDGGMPEDVLPRDR